MDFNLKFIAMTLSLCGLYQQIKKIKRKMLGRVIKVKRKANPRKRAAFKVSFLMPRANLFFFLRLSQKSTKFGPPYQDFILEPDTNQLFSRCFNIRTHEGDFGWRLLKWFTLMLRTTGNERKSFLTSQYSCFKKSHFRWSDDNHGLLFMSSAVKNTAREKP